MCSKFAVVAVQEGLRELFHAQGFRCDALHVRAVCLENRARALAMDRRWVQAALTLVRPPTENGLQGPQARARQDARTGQTPCQEATPGDSGQSSTDLGVRFSGKRQPCRAATAAQAGSSGRQAAQCRPWRGAPGPAPANGLEQRGRGPLHGENGSVRAARPAFKHRAAAAADAGGEGAAQQGQAACNGADDVTSANTCSGGSAAGSHAAAGRDTANVSDSSGAPSGQGAAVRGSDADGSAAVGSHSGAARSESSGARAFHAEWDQSGAEGCGRAGEAADGLGLAALFDGGAPEEVQEQVRPRLAAGRRGPPRCAEGEAHLAALRGSRMQHVAPSSPANLPVGNTLVVASVARAGS